jgi:uncharacterized pyridoxal phosphate-containing UPF0001 family protein
MDISELLAFSVKNKASDLHLSAGLPPMIRVHGDVRRINLPPLAHAVAALPRLKLRGLMAIPVPAADEAAQRRPLRELRLLAERLRADGLALDTLSMGMSADLAAAIAEGSTMVRIGTAIFGKRDYAK